MGRPSASVMKMQVMARLGLDERAEYEALAALNDVNLSELMRMSLEYSKEHFRKQGEESTKRRKNLPHGVTPLLEEQAMSELILDLNNGDIIKLAPGDILTPKSKALHRFLQLIWNPEQTELSRKALDKIAERISRVP